VKQLPGFLASPCLSSEDLSETEILEGATRQRRALQNFGFG